MKSADAVISGKFKEHITYFLTDFTIGSQFTTRFATPLIKCTNGRA